MVELMVSKKILEFLLMRRSAREIFRFGHFLWLVSSTRWSLRTLSMVAGIPPAFLTLVSSLTHWCEVGASFFPQRNRDIFLWGLLHVKLPKSLTTCLVHELRYLVRWCLCGVSLDILQIGFAGNRSPPNFPHVYVNWQQLFCDIWCVSMPWSRMQWVGRSLSLCQSLIANSIVRC